MPVFTESQLLEKILESKFSTEEPINLLCCINDESVNQTVNLMYSIRHFCCDSIKLFILSTGLSDYSKDLLMAKMDFLNISVDIDIVTLSKDEKYSNEWSLDVYLNVFAFKFMPANIEKVLYLDSSMLATDNIKNLYRTDISSSLLACSIDIDVHHPLVFERRKQFGIKHEYFSSGMMLLNLKRQREKWSFEMFDALLKKYKFPYNNQDLLNMVCEEKDIVFVPYKYNFQTWSVINNEDCLKAFEPVFIYYVGDCKPWIERNFNRYTTGLFYECAALTHLAQFCPGEYFQDRLNENIEYSRKNTETISLLCCIDDGYVNPMINLMYSIRQYNRNKIKLFVLSTKISEKSAESIKKSMDYLNIETSIQLCKLPELRTECSYWTIDMYLRVLSFKYLPQDLDKILYIDADTLAMGDIAEVFNQDIQNHIISARKEPFRFQYDRILNSCKDNNFDHEYFSSGVLLFNLKRIRNEWSEKEIFDLINTLTLYFPDQDLLNKLCSEKDILFMPDRYNYYDIGIMANYAEVISRAPVILHYPGHYKPWMQETLNVHEQFFFKAAKLTDIEEYHKNKHMKNF